MSAPDARELLARLWQALGQWSVEICRPDAELAPPQYVLDAVNALAAPAPRPVPREPTPEMIEAGLEWSGLPAATWRAMCEAAPAAVEPTPARDPEATPCEHEWREMRANDDPYRPDECCLCGAVRGEDEPEAPPAEAPPAETIPLTYRWTVTEVSHVPADAWKDLEARRARIESDAARIRELSASEAAERKRADMLWQECENLRIRLAARGEP